MDRRVSLWRSVSPVVGTILSVLRETSAFLCGCLFIIDSAEKAATVYIELLHNFPIIFFPICAPLSLASGTNIIDIVITASPFIR